MLKPEILEQLEHKRQELKLDLSIVVADAEFSKEYLQGGLLVCGGPLTLCTR
ncbi:MAG TPA: hypothetical protein VFY29_06205 [Terriglobia bacterium]|nr:hypothetical protein [Terriglobia bacterium]